MPDTPNYGFNRKPRFSVNHLTRYLSTTNANQRRVIIREAKFPRKLPLSVYGQARRAIQGFLATSDRELSYFDNPLKRLERKVRLEPEKSDEAQRCINAISAFSGAYNARRWSRLTFSPNVVDIPLRTGGVLINVRLDCQVYEDQGDGDLATGGVVLILAATPESRKNLEDRQRQVASTILWSLESQGQMEALPRLCMSHDVFGENIVKAPTAHSRFRQTVTTSCEEAAAMWDSVEPPNGYDGPEWR